MRWEQADEPKAQGSLFDEPVFEREPGRGEFRGIEFLHVKAHRIVNEVKGSPFGFRYTINAYRGCSHACTYCVWGETPVLMADGRTKMIPQVRPGDAVYGTARRGAYRRYVTTTVLDHWSSVKAAYRITLEDGTALIASADHRFLTDRGWKHVTGAEEGAARRPHLTLNDSLVGVGRFATTPKASDDYERGYLCGVIRGDGHIGTYSYPRPGRLKSEFHRFRLALVDGEALSRVQRLLANRGITTRQFLFQAATDVRREVRAIRVQSRPAVDAIRDLVAWPTSASDDRCRGFLAGIYVVEMVNSTNRMRYVRIIGGLRERLRFFHLVDPAITRKRTIDDVAIMSDARLGVVAIQPLGIDLPMYDITTGTGDFIANGVVSHNCFARPTHTYLELDADRDFERKIVVKVNVPELVRSELARESWGGDHVALGTNTDPYQWVEGRYRLMEGIWEAMRDFANPCSVLTKSPLLLRDIELMKQIAERTEFSTALSVPTIDEKAWRETDPHTPHPRKRLEAV